MLQLSMFRECVHSFTREFILNVWECQDLKYKILIKNKKLKPQIETEDAAGAEESADEGGDDYDDDEEDEEDEDNQTKAKFWSPRKAGSKKKVSQGFSVRLKRFLSDAGLDEIILK